MRQDSIIRALYRGNIHPGEGKIVAGSDYETYHQQCTEKSKELSDMIGTQQQELLDDLTSLWGVLSGCACEVHFAEGFKLGAGLMLEVLDDSADGT